MQDEQVVLARELLRVFSGAQGSSDLVERIPEIVGRSVGFEAAALWLVDVELGRLRCARVWEDGKLPGAPRPAGHRTLAMGSELAGEVWASGRPLWADRGFAFPVVSGSCVIGVVEVSSDTPRLRDDGLLDRMAQTGVDIGGALQHLLDREDRRQVLERLRAAERRQRFLADVSRALAGSLGCDAMLAEVARLAVPIVGDSCVVHLAEEDGSVRVVAAVFADAAKAEPGTRMLRDYPPRPGDDEGVGRVLRTGTSVLYPRVSGALLSAMARSDEHLRMLRAVRPTSVMTVPLPGPETTVGSLTFAQLDPTRAYGPDDLSLAEELGRRVGLAVANAQLYERERMVAAALQRSLLPPELPAVPSVELAAQFHPGGKGVSVGGDFYDVFPVSEGLWVLGVGDVCGIGPEAAAMTARVRYSMRAVASADCGPAESLARVNGLLMDPGCEPRFCTAVYGTLRPSPGTAVATLASAGHPPPLLLRATGEVESVGGQGTLLGVVDAPEQCDEEVVLGAGDLLLLYTDGVIEARRGDAFFGDDRLRALLEGCGGMSASAVAERVQGAVVDFAGGTICDDMAILVARIPPPDGSSVD